MTAALIGQIVLWLWFFGCITTLYECEIKGTISEERFSKMSKGYEDEQAGNRKKISALSEELKNDEKSLMPQKCSLILWKALHIWADRR